MVRKTVGYVQLQWTCPNCNTKNPGLVKLCKSCGSPQPDNVVFEQAEQQEVKKEGEVAEAAKKGADIHCGFCGARNPADAKICSQCGGDIKEGKARQAGQVVGALVQDKTGGQPKVCPHCGSKNLPTAQTCSSCGANLTSEKESLASQDLAAAPSTAKKFPKGCIIGLCAAAVLIIIGFIIMSILSASTKESLVATVQDVSWKRVLNIEAFGPISKEAWQDEIPVGAEVGTCREELHHTQSEPAAGAEEVCGTPYVVDSGSGAGEVMQDCEYRVFAEYCQYTVDDWQVVDQAVLEGSNPNPQWPSPSLGSNERTADQSEEYTIIFDTSDGSYTYTTNDPDDFAQYDLGTKWKLNVNAFNTILSIEPQ